ncbi:MAG: butyrate kinase [Tissierellales bacterium]|nr:butyrate kinase [Tissierellales bacterium]
MNKIFVINIGSTSTKLAYYEDEKCIVKDSINHPTKEISEFKDFWEQDDYRTNKIEKFMKDNNIDIAQLDAIVSRGGHTKSVTSGVYKVNEKMINQQKSGKWGKHPCDLGSTIAYRMSEDKKAMPLIVDPPITDEFEPIARVSGHPLIERRSSFHALSHKATAKRYARENGLDYNDLNLVVVHLGGGISVAPHYKGKMIDGENGLEGDGPFSTTRTGGLPVGDLTRLCYSGKYTYEEMISMINGNGGLVAYLGTADVKKIEEESKYDKKSAFYLDAMIYQVCKQIGAMATVLNGKVDAILITGGVAYSENIIKKIKMKCQYIAQIVVYPGENEMESLARGALEGLNDKNKIIDFNA